MDKNSINDLSFQIIGAAIEVHKQLGPGLLEKVYQNCMKTELHSRKIRFASEVYVPIHYKEQLIPHPLKIDLLVEDLIVVELKAVEILHPVYKSQLLTYLKLTEKPKGLLINFFTDNIVRSTISMVGSKFRNL